MKETSLRDDCQRPVVGGQGVQGYCCRAISREQLYGLSARNITSNLDFVRTELTNDNFIDSGQHAAKDMPCPEQKVVLKGNKLK